MGVVRASVPILIDLDFLDKFVLFCNNVDNVLCCPNPGTEISLCRKRGHIYLESNKSANVMQAYPDLIKPHRNFL